jgi:hypothetical protein
MRRPPSPSAQSTRRTRSPGPTTGDEIIWGTTPLGSDYRGVLVYGDAIDWRFVTADSLVWGSLGTGTSPGSTQFSLWNPVF